MTNMLRLVANHQLFDFVTVIHFGTHFGTLNPYLGDCAKFSYTLNPAPVSFLQSIIV